MRVALVRSDLGHLYLDDIENASQRCFSSEPVGQSRYFHKPTDAELSAVLAAKANLTVLGSDTAATVATNGSNQTKLNIKTSASAAFTQVVVTSGATQTKASIASDLNAAFAAAGLGLVARVTAATKIAIDSVTGGPNAYINIDASSPSTAALQTQLGLSTGATVGLTLAALKTAVYPTAVTVNVAPATIEALSTFVNMTTAQKAALDAAIADLVAPSLVETGPVLLSFVYGKLSKLKSALCQPGGARAGLPAGIAVAIVANDGSTVFSV